MTSSAFVPHQANLLRLIRRAPELAPRARSNDEQFLLLAGLMPKDFLTHILGYYPEYRIERYIKLNVLWESDNYLKANPRVRTRQVETRYSIERPILPKGLNFRYPSSYKIRGKDKLLLWYAAANHDLSGSLGEPEGLRRILDFMRLKNVQRIWRRHIQRPTFRLPKDAI